MTPQRSTKRATIQRVNRTQTRRVRDVLAIEDPLEIHLVFEVGGHRVEKSISITMRTPGDDFELAAGFLFNEGIVPDHEAIESMRYCVGPDKHKQHYNVISVFLRPGVYFDPERLQRHFYTTSSCGVCGKASLEALAIGGCPVLPVDRPRISHQLVFQLNEQLRQAQVLFEQTGGLHAAALFDVQGSLISIREDVGRHNAVDKLVGEQLLAKRIPCHEMLMMVSGRSSFEILQKALMAGIPFVAAVGAPSSLAVELAREFNMTLLGFVRDDSFNVYAGEQRLVP